MTDTGEDDDGDDSDWYDDYVAEEARAELVADISPWSPRPSASGSG
jgi:hypothetical protein